MSWIRPVPGVGCRPDQLQDHLPWRRAGRWPVSPPEQLKSLSHTGSSRLNALTSGWPTPAPRGGTTALWCQLDAGLLGGRAGENLGLAHR